MSKLKTGGIVLALALLAGAVAVAAWPRPRGVNTLFPETFEAGGQRLSRVAETDGNDCAGLANHTKGVELSERIHRILLDSGCKQSLRVVYSRPDGALVTLGAVRLPAADDAEQLLGRLGPLHPAVRGLGLIRTREGADKASFPVKISTDATSTVVDDPRVLGEWLVLVEAGYGDQKYHPEQTGPLHEAADAVIERFRSEVQK